MVSSPWTRRELGLAVMATWLGSGRAGPWGRGLQRAVEDEADPESGWRALAFEPTPEQPAGQAAELFVPEHAATAPILVALHGHGESARGLDAGAQAWRRDYQLEKLYRRLQAPPLETADVGGFLDDARLASINASLAKHPFDGIGVACPYTPDVAAPDSDWARGYASFVIDALLPRSAEVMGITLERERTGIDGVSMGGRMALIVGLAHPEVFGTIGALMPALVPVEVGVFADFAARAYERAPFRLQLVTSDRDPALEAIKAFSDQLRRREVPHRLGLTQGPHDYVWNRGAGACEMLVFHERTLRGLDAP